MKTNAINKLNPNFLNILKNIFFFKDKYSPFLLNSKKQR